MRTSWLWLCMTLVLVTVAGAQAQPPSPLDIAGPYAFPGALQGPASAASAGRGLADRWLGDEPFDNPAAAPPRGVMLAPVVLRVLRQDLPAQYRNYDEAAAFPDGAGGWLSFPVRGFGLALYAYQPVLRLEDAAYTSAPDQVPGTFTSTSAMRELRSGLALSRAWRTARLGAALEWTRRSDSYDFTERSGDPFSGLRHADFSGDGFGFQAGARVAAGARVTVGVALRYVPALDLSGEQRIEAPESVQAVSVTRASGWEGGLSMRVSVTGAFGVLVSTGGRTAQSWDGFGVTTGRTAVWALGLDYDHDADPWALRFGLGRDQQDGVSEPRAGVIGLGLGWKLDALRLDAAVLRRSIERPGRATSYDDRFLVGATVPF